MLSGPVPSFLRDNALLVPKIAVLSLSAVRPKLAPAARVLQRYRLVSRAPAVAWLRHAATRPPIPASVVAWLSRIAAACPSCLSISFCDCLAVSHCSCLIVSLSCTCSHLAVSHCNRLTSRLSFLLRSPGCLALQPPDRLSFIALAVAWLSRIAAARPPYLSFLFFLPPFPASSCGHVEVSTCPTRD